MWHFLKFFVRSGSVAIPWHQKFMKTSGVDEAAEGRSIKIGESGRDNAIWFACSLGELWSNTKKMAGTRWRCPQGRRWFILAMDALTTPNVCSLPHKANMTTNFRNPLQDISVWVFEVCWRCLRKHGRVSWSARPLRVFLCAYAEKEMCYRLCVIDSLCYRRVTSEKEENYFSFINVDFFLYWNFF